MDVTKVCSQGSSGQKYLFHYLLLGLIKYHITLPTRQEWLIRLKIWVWVYTTPVVQRFFAMGIERNWEVIFLMPSAPQLGLHLGPHHNCRIGNHDWTLKHRSFGADSIGPLICQWSRVCRLMKPLLLSGFSRCLVSISYPILSSQLRMKV